MSEHAMAIACLFTSLSITLRLAVVLSSRVDKITSVVIVWFSYLRLKKKINFQSILERFPSVKRCVVVVTIPYLCRRSSRRKKLHPKDKEEGKRHAYHFNHKLL